MLRLNSRRVGDGGNIGPARPLNGPARTRARAQPPPTRRISSRRDTAVPMPHGSTRPRQTPWPTGTAFQSAAGTISRDVPQSGPQDPAASSVRSAQPAPSADRLSTARRCRRASDGRRNGVPQTRGRHSQGASGHGNSRPLPDTAEAGPPRAVSSRHGPSAPAGSSGILRAGPV